MKNNVCLLFLILMLACRERYEAPVNVGDKALLVVEGFINTGKGATSITLSKVNELSNNGIIYLRNAVVEIESDNNQVFALREGTAGVYTANQLVLDTSRHYRLHIRTADNKEYVSDFIKSRHTPPIDSVSWKRDADGLRIYVNTHDPKNQTKFYRWEYQQTWEVHSSYAPNVRYRITSIAGGLQYGIEYIDPATTSEDTTRMKCWIYNNSTSILLGSSQKLSEDAMSEFLVSIPKATRTLSVLYSILVKQYAISKEEYEFLQIMKKNTEQTGSVFDPQPSQLKGNIRSISDPGEPVIGYVGAYSAEEKRIFIRNRDVPGWGFNTGCFETKVINHPDSVRQAYTYQLYPTVVVDRLPGNGIGSFNVSYGTCVDCTLFGSNKKPAYWP